jgi:hypothetical protein
MGLKSFLKNQGFIEDDKPASSGSDKKTANQSGNQEVTSVPSFFPIGEKESYAESGGNADPSFVTPLQKSASQRETVDPSFVKFFEDEMVKANLEGPDYFEFRQQLLKTQQKMSAKGMAASDVVLQAVLMSFDAQGISADKLVSAAQHYKSVIKQKNDDFLKGADEEKNNQLQKRQSVLKSHADNIDKLQQQIQQLEVQKQQLVEAMNKEKTQQEVDKTLGKEGIEKIERAERLINIAHDYMQATIDNDIKKLQSV